MKKFLFLLLGFCQFILLNAQSVEKYASVRISLQTRTLNELALMGIETDHGEYQPGVYFTAVLSEDEQARVRAAGFETQVLIPDLLEHYLAHRYAPATNPVASRGDDCQALDPVFDYPIPVNYSYGTMGGYYTYQELMNELDKMRQLYPNLVSARMVTSDTILTWEGRPIYHVKISDLPDQEEQEPEVLYTALHHAREPGSASQMIFFMWYLLENYGTRADIKALLDNLELYFIPCINVDGYLFNEQGNPNGGGFWRKNLRPNNDGSFGVDLNRNYGYYWGVEGGSSPDPVSAIYRGPEPFSEPETRTIRDFCRVHDFEFVLNYHSYGNLLIYPWSYNDSPADSSFTHYARHFTDENHFRHGTSINTVGYAVSGNSDDWMHAETGGHAFTPEVGPSTLGFWPPFSQIMPQNLSCVAQNLRMAFSALKYAETKDLGGKYFYGRVGDLPMDLRRYGKQNHDITVQLEPLSSNIESGIQSRTFQLGALEQALFNFPYELKLGIQDQDEVQFLLKTDNGLWVQTDTLKKRFRNFSLQSQSLFEDQFNDLNHWTGDWQLTTEAYHSAPTSLTDSPNAAYSPDSYTVGALDPIFYIPESALDVTLRFWSKWAIHENSDFVQLIVFDGSGAGIPMCGRYTEPGVGNQPEEPLWDGYENNWVEECVSLNDFLGKDIQLVFTLVSDSDNTYDGFYVDDLTLEYKLAISGTRQVDLMALSVWQNEPNPADEFTVIRWVDPNAGKEECNLLIYNSLGEEIRTVSLGQQSTQQVRVDTHTLPSGLYYYQITTGKSSSSMLKLMVQH